MTQLIPFYGKPLCLVTSVQQALWAGTAWPTPSIFTALLRLYQLVLQHWMLYNKYNLMFQGFDTITVYHSPPLTVHCRRSCSLAVFLLEVAQGPWSGSDTFLSRKKLSLHLDAKGAGKRRPWSGSSHYGRGSMGFWWTASYLFCKYHHHRPHPHFWMGKRRLQFLNNSPKVIADKWQRLDVEPGSPFSNPTCLPLYLLSHGDE